MVGRLTLASAAALAVAVHAASIDLMPSAHAQTGFTTPIVSKVPRRRSKSDALHSLRTRSTAGKSASPPTAVLSGAYYDFEYLVPIEVDGQPFVVIVDTGSSDTWVVEKNFQCLNLTGSVQQPTSCKFGSGGFDTTHSKTFAPYPDSQFYVAYGDGEYLSGTAGKATIGVGGLNVTKQVFGLANKTAWEGDGINSGLLGLAYPTLTSVSSASHGDQLEYDPFFFNAVKQGIISETYFSLALNRGTTAGKSSTSLDPHLGYLTFGGLPPVATVPDTSTTVPLQAFTAGGREPISGTSPTPKAYFYYTVDIQSYFFPNSSRIAGGTSSNKTIIDSGTTLNMLPSPVAQAYNGLWAKWRSGSWYVPCSAVAPPFVVQLGGKNYTIDARDLVVPVEDGECVSGIQDGGDEDVDGNMFILGDVFLHNVVAQFDIGKNRMTFAQRKPY
ncbi:Acid protease [Mycena chlorophos]|uniref:Acid protease n=1 Tax=Mycena chlorophos TaxID=658473 RepID=A0A8H6TKR8_MYCCL|nr:Acid protease [Mycena chlorophos]